MWLMVLLLVGAALPLVSTQCDNAEQQMAELRHRLVASFIPTAGPDAHDMVLNATIATETLLPNGTWSDVMYYPPPGLDTRSIWPPSVHRSRVELMAKAVVSPNASTFGNQTILAAATKALVQWLNLNLTNPDNWYQNLISNPLSVGRIGLMLPNLPSSVVDECSHVAFRANWNAPPPPGMSQISGGNLVWMTTATAYGGLLIRSSSTIQSASKRMYQELDVTGGQHPGVKADGAFFQHCNPVGKSGKPLGVYGNLYSGGYGQAFTGLLLQWIAYTSGLSCFEIPKTSAQMFSDFVLDGQRWSLVGSSAPHWDTSVIGRELSRPGHRIEWLPDAFAQLNAAFPRVEELHELGQWLGQNGSLSSSRARLNKWVYVPNPTPLGNKMFWKADYMVHRTISALQKPYSVSLRGTSVRMVNTECIAKENTQGRHLGYGSLFTYFVGDEHTNAYPLWDWESVPFTTVQRDGNTICKEYSPNNGTYPPSNSSCWADCHESETTGTTVAVGGVSTGKIGAMSILHDARRGSLSYSMAAFLGEGFHLIVHTDITTDGPFAVSTALQQEPLAGPVKLGSLDPNGFKAILEKNGTYSFAWNSEGSRDAPSWMTHGSSAYIPLKITGVDQILHTIEIDIDKDRTSSYSAIGIESDNVTGSMFRGRIVYNGADVARGVGFQATLVIPGIDTVDFSGGAATKFKDAVKVIYAKKNHTAILLQRRNIFNPQCTKSAAALFFRGAGSIPVSTTSEDPFWNFTLTASVGVLALIEYDSASPDTFNIYISDPSQSERTLTMSGFGIDLSRCQIEAEVLSGKRSLYYSNHQFVVTLPDKENAGKTVMVICHRNIR